MIREWKRMLCSRSVLSAAALLLFVNLGLFWLLYGGNKAQFTEKKKLFDVLESGSVAEDTLRQEYTELERVQQFFAFENAKQNAPEFYAMVYENQEEQYRTTFPELAAAFDRGEYEEQSVQGRIASLSAVLESVDYTYGFYEKLNEVFQNAEKLSGISIFQNNGDVDPNLTKTAEDYRRLEQIQVTAGNDTPINALLRFRVPGLLGLIFAFVLVSVTIAEQQYGLRPLIFATKHGRGKLTAYRGLGLLFGSVIFGGALFGLTICLSNNLLGGVDLNRMVQSVPALFSLTTPMTIREFLGLYLACGIGVQVMLTMVVWLVFSVMEQRQMAMLTAAGLVGGSWLLYRVIPVQSFLAVLKYANPAAGMDFIGCLAVYRNLGVGSALVEKNWVVLCTGIMLTALCTGFAIRHGIKCYSISSHGKLYALVQKWMKSLNNRYHTMIAKLGFGGLESYKVLVMQKGILVLLVLGFLLVQFYPVRQITYVGEAQFLRGFYEEFSGQGITPELTAYVEALQEKLDSVEAEFHGSQQAFEDGKIDTTQYLTASQKYAAFDVQRKALSTIREKIAWVESQNAQGFDAVILDSSGYDRLLEQSDSDRIMVLIALFGCITLSALLFPVEQKPGLRPMIRSTQKGRQVLAAKKLTLGLILSVVVFGLYALIRIGTIGMTYGFDVLTAPAHSLMQFGQSGWNLPIWVTLTGWLASQWLVFGVVSVLVCLLTQWINMIAAVMISVVLSMGTAVLSLFGMGLPTIWNLLERVTCWLSQGDCIWLISVALMLIVEWIMVVRLWSRNGRRKP